MAVAEGSAVTDLDRFLGQPGRDEAVAKVRERIDAEGVTYVYYQFVSVTGRIMGKGVPAAHWESMARKGFQLVYGSTANLFIDRHGDYIGYGPEAAELVGIPEPETFEVAAVGPQGRPRVVHVLPRTARSARARRVPHVRLPRQPEPHPDDVRGRAPACTSAPAPSPR